MDEKIETPSHRKGDERGCPSSTPLGGRQVEDQREARRTSKVKGAIRRLKGKKRSS